ncbi:MAG TPA: peptidoglycan-binding domain-containing protein [Polyangia bacterium]|nr:peptidoglycan-binding domain-containing protein [Polyangia bacterium]
MTARRSLVGALLVALASCGHTRSVEPTSEPGHERPPFDQSASSVHKPEPVAGAPSSSGPSRSPTGLPLPTSPAGLLKPGAAKAIQERLIHAGALSRRTTTDELDGETRAALERYQKSQGLPATGDPDGATIDRLGLKAEDVFVSAKR